MTYLSRLEATAKIIPTASHAKLDEICAENHGRISLRGPAKRDLLVNRREMLLRTVTKRIEQHHANVAYQAERDAFIGPRTIRDQNGHPY